MIYGVEQSTDLHYPKVVIKKFTSVSAAKKWQETKNGKFTYSDPEGARNYHHTFRYIFELQGRIDKKNKIFKNEGSRDYPKTYNDQVFDYLCKCGKEIKGNKETV